MPESIRDKLINAIDILDGTKPNPEHNSQMLWNSEHEYLRGLLVKCVHLIDKQKDDIECWQEVIKKFKHLPGLCGFWEMKGQDVKCKDCVHWDEQRYRTYSGYCNMFNENTDYEYECQKVESTCQGCTEWISVKDKLPELCTKIKVKRFDGSTFDGILIRWHQIEEEFHVWLNDVKMPSILITH